MVLEPDFISDFWNSRFRIKYQGDSPEFSALQIQFWLKMRQFRISDLRIMSECNTMVNFKTKFVYNGSEYSFQGSFYCSTNCYT